MSGKNKRTELKKKPFAEFIPNVASAQECTGMMPAQVFAEGQAEELAALGGIPPQPGKTEDGGV